MRTHPSKVPELKEMTLTGKIDFFLILSSFSRWATKIMGKNFHASTAILKFLRSNLAGPQRYQISAKYELSENVRVNFANCLT